MTTLPLEAQCTHRAPLRAESAQRMTVVLALSALVMIAEAVGAYLSGSLALLADAGHMLVDVGALALALLAARIAQRPATAERSFGLVRFEILLEAPPAHISLPAVHERIAAVPGVESVHDLHVWTVTSGVVAMSGHLVVKDPTANQRVLEDVQQRMEGFGIAHVTVQLERDPTCE